MALQVIGPGLLFIIATIPAVGFAGLTEGFVGQWLSRRPAVWRIMNIIAGTGFILLTGGLLSDPGLPRWFHPLHTIVRAL